MTEDLSITFKFPDTVGINQRMNQLANKYYVPLEYPVVTFCIPLRYKTGFSFNFIFVFRLWSDLYETSVHSISSYDLILGFSVL